MRSPKLLPDLMSDDFGQLMFPFPAFFNVDAVSRGSQRFEIVVRDVTPNRMLNSSRLSPRLEYDLSRQPGQPPRSALPLPSRAFALATLLQTFVLAFAAEFVVLWHLGNLRLNCLQLLQPLRDQLRSFFPTPLRPPEATLHSDFRIRVP